MSSETSLQEEILNRTFAHHVPDGDKASRHAHVRAAMKAAARDILQVTPFCRELSLALTKLEEAMFWANAAIAREGK